MESLNKSKQEMIEDLVKILTQANYDYYVACKPTMPDYKFDMLLKELAKSGLIGEMQLLRHLLHAQLRCFQKHLCLHEHRVVNPLIGRFTRLLSQKHREVLGRDTELRGIESHPMMLSTVRMQQLQELLKQLLLAAQ